MIQNESNLIEIDKLQPYIDEIRDVVHEVWLDEIRAVEQMLEFFDVVKSQVIKDYDEVYDNLGCGEMPSQYTSNEEDYFDV